MALQVYEESKGLISINGDHDNLQHVPGLCEEIIDLCKLFPLWSTVMTPHFANTGNISSSTPVESNINDIKNRICKNLDLPARLDDFIFHHIKTLEGTMTLVEAANNRILKPTSFLTKGRAK